MLPGEERALFSQTLLILIRKLALLCLKFKSDIVMRVNILDSVLKCDHGVTLTASRSIDPAEFTDRF